VRLFAAKPILIFAVALILAIVWLPHVAQADPPQFGVEVEAGTTAGFTPYLRNEVLTDVDRTRTDERGRFLLEPSLADIETGTGTSLGVRLVASNIAGGLSLRWFDLSANRTHHLGQESISQSNRRDDGSVDDSGVTYVPLDPPAEEPIVEDEQNRLFVVGLGGEYRFLWPGEAFDVYAPVGGELVFTYVNRDQGGYRVGLEASGGLGMSVEFVSGVSLMLNGKLHGLLTSHYGRRADAARRAVAIGESTEAAFFSTLLYGSANIALQFKIR
jgi:hypothetical protein